MKARLNLSMDQPLLQKMKAYAAKKNISISALVENYFKKLTRPAKKKNIIELVDQLDVPTIKKRANLKKNYYEKQKKKYGF